MRFGNYPLRLTSRPSLVLALLLCCPPIQGFVFDASRPLSGLPTSRVSLQASPSSSSSSFDLSKPVFDLYSLRSVRGDALTRYNTVNQSEPLRINLSLILTALLLCSPILAPEVTSNDLTTPQLILNLVGAAAIAYLGVWRNRVARNRQLRRWERELSALELRIQLPNVYAATTAKSGNTNVERIGESIENGKKVIALRNFSDAITDEFRALQRRWRQAGVIVVSDDDADEATTSGSRSSWMARPYDSKAYRDFWDDQLSTSTTSNAAGGGGWFGLAAYTGRSFGSGSRPPSSWLQVLGQSLPPLQEFSADDASSKDATTTGSSRMDPALRTQQAAFYDTLTSTEDEETMVNTIFSSKKAEQVSEVIAEGGRLDSWSSCLQPDARPVGLTIVDVDDYVPPSTSNSDDAPCKFTTCVEVTATGETLLAVQTWDAEDGKLLLHQTIPWSNTAPAAGTLLCDCRGCVSLVRQ